MLVSVTSLLVLLAASASTASVSSGGKDASIHLNIIDPDKGVDPTGEGEGGPFKTYLTANSIKSSKKTLNFVHNSPQSREAHKKSQLNWGTFGENGTSEDRGATRTFENKLGGRDSTTKPQLNLGTSGETGISDAREGSQATKNTLGSRTSSTKPQLNWGTAGEIGTPDAGTSSRTLGTTRSEDGALTEPNERKAVTFDFQLWSKNSNGEPIVKYHIGNTLVAESTIRSSIAHYEEHTCLRFQEVGSFLFSPRINFVNGGGCSSMIGRQMTSFLFGQNINLNQNCDSERIVIHEIGHAIGLYHEQSRHDRNSHVSINYWNAEFNRWGNFYKNLFTRTFDTEYDYYSVMHYGPTAFSWNGRTTVSTKDPLLQGLLLYPREGLSFMDKLIVNRLYDCIDMWVTGCPSLSADPCQNHGYVGPDCQCQCPPGTSGDTCQNKAMGYTEALVDEFLPNNEEITSPGTISSTGYPTPQDDLALFTKVITAPSCDRVVLTVVGFEMASTTSEGRCRDEALEIRVSESASSGVWYCGQDLAVGDTISSDDNVMILFYVKNTMVSNPNDGFSFDITFEDIPGCSRR